MRIFYTFFIVSLVLFALTGCSSVSQQDKVIAKIGNAQLFVSDAEFLASIKPENLRSKEIIAADLQGVADTRRIAEVARFMFAGEQNNVQKDLAESENARLAQVYTYFYVNANMKNSNKALLDFYKKNKNRYMDSSASPVWSPLAVYREKIAADLFLEQNLELSAIVNDSNKVAIIDSVRRAISGSELENLKKLYNVELVKIEPPGIEEYYKNNQKEFQTKTMYKLLGLSDLDSIVLAGKIKDIATREEFAKIAKEMPIAKQGHAIMDIGMFPSLDAEVSALGAKKFTKILRAPDTQAYYVFYIDSIIAPTVKPFDRAKSLVKSVLENGEDIPLDSSTVLATINGKTFITEKDVLELRSKVPPNRRAMFRREAALNSLIERNIFAKAAKEKAIDKSIEYIAWTRQITDQMYSQILTDSVLTTTLNFPEEVLKATYDLEKDSLFSSMDFEAVKTDIAVWLSIPDISYRREFALNKNRYAPTENWQSAKRSIYKNIRYRELAGIQERKLFGLQKNIPVSMLDSSWGLELAFNNFEELSAKAKDYYEKRDLQKSKKLFEKARTLFVENDSAQKVISFELANISQELGNYNEAINEYKIITELWSQDNDAYKAYFMQGFILNEYEKKDSLALIAFEEMLRKFPNSELSDDAKIMVDNIKSGGKVLEDLIKKIESSSEIELQNE